MLAEVAVAGADLAAISAGAKLGIWGALKKNGGIGGGGNIGGTSNDEGGGMFGNGI